MHAPAIRIVPLVDDEELRNVTGELIASPPDIVVVTTGIGFRGWVEAAHGWDVADGLIEALGSTRILARGPKARGAVRQAGLCEQWSPNPNRPRRFSTSFSRRRGRIADRGPIARRGNRMGAGHRHLRRVDRCRRRGDKGARLPVELPGDLRRMDQLIGAIVNGELDAVSFTSAPAVAATLDRAKALGALDALLVAMRDDVRVMCVGPVTSAPFDKLDVPTSYPQRYRLGALARLITDELPTGAARFSAGGHVISIRCASVEVDGTVKSVAPAGMSLLKCLLVQPGRVVSRDELLAALPGGGDDTHAVETGMARLRSALDAPRVIQTVVKRGYRLAVDPEGIE